MARVIVAEDDAPMRDAIVHVLVAEGHDVSDVDDGPPVLDLIDDDAARRPEVAVLDLDLPGLSGFEVLDELRELEPPVPAILMTGLPSPEVRLEARRRGAFALLEKPFAAHELCELVRRATRGRIFAVPRRVSLVGT